MTREEAIEIIQYASAFNSANSPLTKALDMAIEALRLNPDAARKSIDEVIKAAQQPERPKGRWERFMFFNTVKQCSVCGCTTDCTPNFCPNCGADMRGEEE